MTAYNSTTTLAEIRAAGPCPVGWEKLLKHLGKSKADDAPLQLLAILESNGLDDAIWCLRVPSLDRLSRHFQAWCADQVLHFFEAKMPSDTRVSDQIAMLRNNNATDKERAAARDAARAAARAAAWDAARDAAWAAERAAAWDAAWAAARAAERDAARDAAWDAARAAAWDAARDAAWAAERDAARDAAWAAARDAQELQIRKMITGETK